MKTVGILAVLVVIIFPVMNAQDEGKILLTPAVFCVIYKQNFWFAIY